MERGQRIGLIVAAVVVAVVAFLVLSGGDDDEDSTTTQADDRETQPTTTGEPTATVPAPKPQPEFETIRVVGGEPQGGVKKITVEQGRHRPVARFGPTRPPRSTCTATTSSRTSRPAAP